MSRWLRCGVLIAFALGAAQAVDWEALKPQGYVSDFAGVVDAAGRAQLERYAAAVEHATGAEMALVTIPTLEGEPVEDVANTLFRAWGVGRKGHNDGIMLLLVVADHRSRLEVGYGLEPLIPDGFAGSVLRQMRPALRARQYGEALAAAAQTMGSRIAEAKGVKIDATLERRAPPAGDDAIPWSWLLGGALLLAWFLGARRGPFAGYVGGFLPGLVLGGLAGRSTWGGRSSGGFGGYDSGDSFGGFGGGDSGGGGASGDW
jgi:uncharacterized protein